MGMFDCLIDKNNGNPKSDMEYIYRLDMVWVLDKLESKPIEIGTIMCDVKQCTNGSYEFTCKETGERLRTNYAWALAENTPENVKRINKFDTEYLIFKKYEARINSYRNNIVTLKDSDNIQSNKKEV